MAVDLGKQVGPLPLGAWVVVVGAGLGLAYYGYNNQKAAPEEVRDTSGDPGVGVGGTGDWLDVNPPAAGSGVVEGPITTNDEWARRAINHLIAQNYNPALADSAIRKYISGASPSITEWALITIALAKFGSPPVPLPPIEGNPPPPTQSPPPVTTPPPVTNPPPPTTTPTFRYYTVRVWPAKGSTLWGIAEIYYGNGKRYVDIFNANRKGTIRADKKPGMITNPSLILPGWVLLIPK
jgi:nucleoid-associated protein YgaU